MSGDSSNNNDPLEKVDWEDVLETLEEQKCVLFLGSRAFKAPGGGQLDLALCNWLDAQNPDHPHIQVYNPDGFFLFKKSRFRRRVITEMKRFYSQVFPETEEYFNRLAQLPFSIIITLPPDNILSKIFDHLRFEYHSDFYFRNRRAAEEYEKPTKDKPLIYNLLGNIEEPESLVLTHSDFFDYLESVFKGNSMNTELKDELEHMDRYIFLGLPYEKWYFQLLLRVFSMHSDRLKEIERLALKEFEDVRLHKIYTEEFKIEFFPGETEAFINELYRRCKVAGILKSIPANPLSEDTPKLDFALMRKWIATAKTEKVMLKLQAYLDTLKPRTTTLANDLLVLRNQDHLLKQRVLKGTIDSRDWRVENNQITERLISIIDKSQTIGF